MQVSEAMTRDVKIARPEQTIQQAARLMVEIDAGLLPVSQGDELIGRITDRDIAVRAVAGGKGQQTPVREVMSEEVKYCFEAQDVAQVTRDMGQREQRRG